jgi:hypothetical protein
MIRRILLVPVVAAVAVTLVVLGFGLGTDSANFHGHAAGHWIMAIPAVFVALVLARLPEARTTPRRIVRLFFTLVVASFALSLLMEGAGAFAYAGKGTENALLAWMHDAGGAITLFAIFSAPLALILLGFVYSLAAIRWTIVRLSSRTAT